MASVPVCRRTLSRPCFFGGLRCFETRSSLYQYLTCAKAPCATNRKPGSASRSETGVPESSPLRTCPASPLAGERRAPALCRVRFAHDQRTGFRAPRGRFLGGPKFECLGRPSGCPDPAQWRLPNIRAANVRVERAPALQSRACTVLLSAGSLHTPCVLDEKGQSCIFSDPLPSTLRIECRVAHRPGRGSPCVYSSRSALRTLFCTW